MKTHLVVVVFLLFSAPLTAQQDYSKLPTLPVWYELNDTGYGQAMTYLPNFDTARKGFNALAHYVNENTNPTWYNRFQGDTENMFDWGKRVLVSDRADFNGDGVIDYYVNGRGMIFRGIENGKPPKIPADAEYNFQHSVVIGTFPADFNSDGKSDIILRSSDVPTKNQYLGSILLGNSDLTKMQLILLSHTFDSTECIVDAFAKGDGTGRMVTMVRDDFQRIGKMVLWKLNFSLSGTETKIQYQRLAELSVPYTPSLSSAGIIGIHRNNQHTIIRFDNTYALENDTFIFVAKPTYRYSRALTHSMSDVEKPGFLGIGNIDDPDPNKRPGLLLQGDPRHDTVPFARVPLFYYENGDNTWSYTEAISIGDVNNDGAGDLAIHYQGVINFEEVRRFVIYLGIPKNTSVETIKPEATGGLAINYLSPNPVSRRGALQLRISSPSPTQCVLSLTDLQGDMILELWRGTTEGGTQTIPIELGKFALYGGWYNLRLSCTDGSVKTGIIIE